MLDERCVSLNFVLSQRKPLLQYLISKFYNKEVSSSSNQEGIRKLREVPQEAIESVHCTKNRENSQDTKRNLVSIISPQTTVVLPEL